MTQHPMTRLGVCYFPEHWPRARWADDAKRMADMGLAQVRIGEFAWSRIEPHPERLEWGWLDDALEILHEAGLGVVLCTPTATPPKWLIDAQPSILARGRDGQVRRFGSRRHYCFSSPDYRRESARITEALARRYGRHDAVIGWQTDNEYGCHDTSVSFSDAARDAFRVWLQARYGSVDALNAAWGAVFWSQEVTSFDEVDPPNLTVTEANPAHWLDYRRFASHEVCAFNAVQVEILRQHAPDRFITHNVMGHETGFDHFALGRDLDVVSWDSYPLGFTEQRWWPEADKARYARQGHPDVAAFHHDLYRACGRGRWGVMEQQPGPVNWAPYNPAPLPGMVRLWTLEAAAHGAEFVSYFRWRQAPFAQEQMHAGLLRVDGADAPAAPEVRAAADDLAALGAAARDEDPGPDAEPGARPATAALVFDYDALWMLQVQPQGCDYLGDELAFAFYTAARVRGLNVDIVSPSANLDGYDLILAPCLTSLSAALVTRIRETGAPVLFGPRSGSKTSQFQIPADGAPGPLQDAIRLSVTHVESLRPSLSETGRVGDKPFTISRWKEHVASPLKPVARTLGGDGVWWRSGAINYLSAWPDARLLNIVVDTLLTEIGRAAPVLPEGVRVRQHAGLVFAMNSGPVRVDLPAALPASASGALAAPRDASAYVVGGPSLGVADVAVWRAWAGEAPD